MPYVKIWIHAVWSTKKNDKLLKTKEIRNKVFEHICQNGLEKGLLMEIVSGYDNHVHCLFRLKSDQTIKDAMRLLKGESSHWINKNKLLNFHFQWQKEYFAVSVSESQVGKVKNYIKGQEEHHRKKTFFDEYKEFIEKYGFTVYGKGVND